MLHTPICVKLRYILISDKPKGWVSVLDMCLAGNETRDCYCTGRISCSAHHGQVGWSGITSLTCIIDVLYLPIMTFLMPGADGWWLMTAWTWCGCRSYQGLEGGEAGARCWGNGCDFKFVLHVSTTLWFKTICSCNADYKSLGYCLMRAAINDS